MDRAVSRHGDDSPRAPEDSWFDFARAVGGSTRNELTTLVLERFTGCLLIVELPLRKPGESRWPNDLFDLVVRGGGVFAVCTVGEPAEIIADALISQPVAFLYNAFVIDENPTTRAWLNGVGDEFISDTEQLRLVVVGAYDGDGYVLLTADDLSTAR